MHLQTEHKKILKHNKLNLKSLKMNVVNIL
jgi:hypothetical protein